MPTLRQSSKNSVTSTQLAPADMFEHAWIVESESKLWPTSQLHRNWRELNQCAFIHSSSPDDCSVAGDGLTRCTIPVQQQSWLAPQDPNASCLASPPCPIPAMWNFTWSYRSTNRQWTNFKLLSSCLARLIRLVLTMLWKLSSSVVVDSSC